MSFGGGGGGSSGTQVQRNEPSSVQAPYLTDLYRQAQTQFQAGPQQFFPGQTYAAPSDTTLAAEDATRQAALAQGQFGLGSLVPAFQQQLMSPAQRFSDPMLLKSLEPAFRKIEESSMRGLQQARRDATGKGQLGGTRQGILEAEVLKDMITQKSDIASKLYGDVYGDVLKTQAATLGLAPGIMSTFTQPAQTLAAVGQREDIRAQQPITEAMQRFAFEQAAPSQALGTYGNIVAGTILPGTITSSGGGAGGPSFAARALGGAASGAAIGQTIGSGFGPMGALAGGLIGGFLT